LFCRGKSGRSAIRVLWAGMDSSGKKRRPVYKSLVANGFPPGVAADDCVALRFDGTELAEVVSARPGARAYRVTAEGEEPIEPRRLG
jgi:dipeptidase E